MDRRTFLSSLLLAAVPVRFALAREPASITSLTAYSEVAPSENLPGFQIKAWGTHASWGTARIVDAANELTKLPWRMSPSKVMTHADACIIAVDADFTNGLQHAIAYANATGNRAMLRVAFVLSGNEGPHEPSAVGTALKERGYLVVDSSPKAYEAAVLSMITSSFATESTIGIDFADIVQVFGRPGRAMAAFFPAAPDGRLAGLDLAALPASGHTFVNRFSGPRLTLGQLEDEIGAVFGQAHCDDDVKYSLRLLPPHRISGLAGLSVTRVLPHTV